MEPRGRATPMCFPFPSQHKLHQIHREQPEKLRRACFSFGVCTASYRDHACPELEVLPFLPSIIGWELMALGTTPERWQAHSTSVSSCLLRYHQLSKTSLNLVVLK